MNKRFRAHKCIDQRWNIVTLHRTTKDSLPLSELIHLFVDHFKASKMGIFVVSHSTRLSLLLTFGSLCWYFPIQISERNIIQRCATIFGHSFMHFARNLCNPKLFKILPIVSLDNQCFLCCLFECQENLVRLLQSAPLHTPQLANVKKGNRSFQNREEKRSWGWDWGGLFGTLGLVKPFWFSEKRRRTAAGQALCRPFPFWPVDKAGWQGAEREGGKKGRRVKDKKTKEGHNRH